MTPEVFYISANSYWGSIVLLNSGDDVEFNVHSEVLSAVYNDNQKIMNNVFISYINNHPST